MRGRYVRRSDKQKLTAAFHLGRLPPDFVLAPDYNVAPKTFQPVIRLNRETGERELTQMRWGADAPIKIEAVELNEAYEAHRRDPEAERANLWVTIAAFARSPKRLAQYRSLMWQNPELDTEADDVSMEFTEHLFANLHSYRHDGRLDRSGVPAPSRW